MIGIDSGRVIAIAAGWDRGFALTDDAGVLAWGWNLDGALGDGTLADRPAPVQTACPREIQAIAQGIALTLDGRILQWGGRLPKRKRDGEAGLPVRTSKLGGHPDLPRTTAWPRAEGRPMAFVAQVRLDDLAGLDGDVLPASGLLSFFCASAALGDEDAGRVIYTEAGTPLERADAPAELETDERFTPAPLTATAALSGLPWQSEKLDQLDLSSKQRQAYHDALQPDTDTPIHRILGHPDAIQDDPRSGQNTACLLLQVDSDESVGMMWRDVGRLYYLIEPADLAARRFDRCRLDFQCY